MDAAALAAEAQEWERQAAKVHAHLHQRLAPKDYQLVEQLRHLDELATVAACTAAEQRLLDALAAHFPDHALALQGIIAHVRLSDGECQTAQGLVARDQTC
jgi:hypothetical protein